MKKLWENCEKWRKMRENVFKMGEVGGGGICKRE